jgi:hypothetical protein
MFIVTNLAKIAASPTSQPTANSCVPKTAYKFKTNKTAKDFSKPAMSPNLLATAVHNATTSSTPSPRSGAAVTEQKRPGPKLGTFNDVLPPTLPRPMISSIKRPRDDNRNI